MKGKKVREKTLLLLKRYRIAIAPVYLAMNLCFYGMFIVKHYAADTYLTEALGWEVTADQYWMNGRWLMTLFSKICGRLGLGFTLAQLISWGMGIVSISLASAVVYNILKERIGAEISVKKNIWIALIAFMLISNVFMLEYFIFAEYTGIMCLGLLLSVLAAGAVLKALEYKSVPFYLIGISLGILGINGHQGNFAILVMIAVLCAKDTLSSWKKFLVNNLVIGSAYAIPALCSMIEARIGGAPRSGQGPLDIMASFLKSTEGLKKLLVTGASFMPYGSYAFFVAVVLICFFWFVIRRRSLKALIYLLYYFVILLLGVYAPLMVTDINYIDVVPRTVYIMGGIIPVVLTAMLLHMDISLENSVVLPVCVAAFLFVQYFGAMQLISDHYETNMLDKYEAQFVGARIWDYEEETGVTVTKMALYWDDNVTGYAPDTHWYGAVNERVMSNEWAAPLAIKVLDGHDLQQTEQSEEVYEKYFKGKDWLHIKDEQLVIIGDTLHMCAY
ncbi:MAG TPA: glucosyltransferase domain-containing protein [Candidatus Mediterraneibacter excrementigallinarum]|nr:glucosyltransferase domain-containing protein [Candidatus Mediterraneibacter excrementigallinarum]